MGLTGFFPGLEMLEKLVIRKFLVPVRIIGLDLPVLLRGVLLGLWVRLLVEGFFLLWRQLVPSILI
jgi:hypothetical protein